MTELSLQHRLDDGNDLSEDEHIVRRPACAKVHLINRKTGKLLAVVDDQRSRSRGHRVIFPRKNPPALARAHRALGVSASDPVAPRGLDTVPNIHEHFGQGDERLRVFPEKVRQRLYALGRGPREASFQLRGRKGCNLESDGEHLAAFVISLHNLIQSATDIEGDIRRWKINDVVGRRCRFYGRGGRARNAFSLRHGASLCLTKRSTHMH